VPTVSFRTLDGTQGAQLQCYARRCCERRCRQELRLLLVSPDLTRLLHRRQMLRYSSPRIGNHCPARTVCRNCTPCLQGASDVARCSKRQASQEGGRNTHGIRHRDAVFPETLPFEGGVASLLRLLMLPRQQLSQHLRVPQRYQRSTRHTGTHSRGRNGRRSRSGDRRGPSIGESRLCSSCRAPCSRNRSGSPRRVLSLVGRSPHPGTRPGSMQCTGNRFLGRMRHHSHKSSGQDDRASAKGRRGNQPVGGSKIGAPCQAA
jgi:hypothetical protein